MSYLVNEIGSMHPIVISIDIRKNEQNVKFYLEFKI